LSQKKQKARYIFYENSLKSQVEWQLIDTRLRYFDAVNFDAWKLLHRNFAYKIVGASTEKNSETFPTIPQHLVNSAKFGFKSPICQIESLAIFCSKAIFACCGGEVKTRKTNRTPKTKKASGVLPRSSGFM